MIDTHKHNTKFALARILRKEYSLAEEATFDIINTIHDDQKKNSFTVVGPEYSGDKDLLHANFVGYCWDKKLKSKCSW